MASDERALATWLAARDDVALAATLAARGVSPTTGWSDFFDAAEALLEPASVDRALIRLPRRLLSAVVGPGADRAATSTLEPLGLLTAEAVPYEAVLGRAEALHAEHPSAFAALGDTPPPPADAVQTAGAAERAFATVGALADVLLAAVHVPLSRTGAGPVSAVDRKRLAESGVVDSSEQLEDLLAAAAAAGLAAASDREWTTSREGEAWLESSTATRWARVAEGIRDRAVAGMRAADTGLPAPQSWLDEFPLDPEWPSRAAQLRRLAVAWGLLDPSGAEPTWGSALRAGAAADTASLSAHLPAEIDRVYLQADLSAIAPGPLAPALDLRLRRMAARESRAQASTYRFTTGSVTLGLAEGETAETMLGFLEPLSLTGIPQPLRYLIESTSARHGLVRVGSTAGRTVIESSDAAILDTILVDQALRPLGLLAENGVLTSRVARDAVYWSLAEARYPVVALDTSGAPESLHRRAPSATSTAASAPVEAYARLIEILRGGHDASGDAGWLDRELDQAVRARAEIVVVVRMPDGSERSMTLEAAGLGGGRLRGRDRAADIERTLPVSSIVSVRPA